MTTPRFTYNKGLVATLGLGTAAAATTVKMYNDYEKDLDYVRRVAVRRANMANMDPDLTSDLSNKQPATAKIKEAGIMDSVKELRDTLKTFTDPAVDIDATGKTVNVGIKGHLPGDIVNAVTTLDNDPGNHKKKALLGLTGTVAGILAAKHYLGNGVGEEIGRQLQPSSGPAKGGIIEALLSASTPAAIYYAVQNRDKPGRAGLGATAAAGSIALKNEARKNIASTGIPAELVVPLAKVNASVALAAGSGLYTMHQLQAAADTAKLEALKAAELSDVEKAKEINRIRSRKDFLTRYPAFRPAPYAEKLREVYNRFHKPEPKVSASDYQRIILRGQ